MADDSKTPMIPTITIESPGADTCVEAVSGEVDIQGLVSYEIELVYVACSGSFADLNQPTPVSDAVDVVPEEGEYTVSVVVANSVSNDTCNGNSDEARNFVRAWGMYKVGEDEVFAPADKRFYAYGTDNGEGKSKG